MVTRDENAHFASRDNASVHAHVELGPDFYAIARERLGGGAAGVSKLIEITVKQLKNLHSDGVLVRDANGKVIRGHLDLKAFGLQDEEIKILKDEIQKEKEASALTCAMRTLGAELYESALTAMGGEKKLAAAVIEQLDPLQQQGVALRTEQGIFRTDVLDMSRLGLSPDQVMQRRSDLGHIPAPAVENVAGLGDRVQQHHGAERGAF